MFALKGNLRPNLTPLIFAIRKERCVYDTEETKYNLNINHIRKFEILVNIEFKEFYNSKNNNCCENLLLFRR